MVLGRRAGNVGCKRKGTHFSYARPRMFATDCDFRKLAGDLETFSLGKVAEGLPLGLDTQSRAALFRIFREEQGVALHACAIIVAHNRGATDVKRRVP
jgi:hypothetical protein